MLNFILLFFLIIQFSIYSDSICDSSRVGAFEVSSLKLYFSRYEKDSSHGKFLQRVCQEKGGRLPTLGEINYAKSLSNQDNYLKGFIFYGGKHFRNREVDDPTHTSLGITEKIGSEPKHYYLKSDDLYEIVQDEIGFRCIVDKNGLHGWNRWVPLTEDKKANHPNLAKAICEKNGYRLPTNLELEEAIKVGVCSLNPKTWEQDFWVETYKSPAKWEFFNREENSIENTKKAQSKRVVCINTKLDPILIEKLDYALFIKKEKEEFQKRIDFVANQFVVTGKYALPKNGESLCRSKGMQLPK